MTEYHPPLLVDLGPSLIAHGVPAMAPVQTGPPTDRPRAEAVDRPRQPGDPCYRDDDCAMYACILCGGTGIVRDRQAPDAPPEPVVPVSRMLAALARLEGLLRHDQRKDAA